MTTSTAEEKDQYTAKKGQERSESQIRIRDGPGSIQCQQDFSPGGEKSDGGMEQSVLTLLLMVEYWVYIHTSSASNYCSYCKVSLLPMLKKKGKNLNLRQWQGKAWINQCRRRTFIASTISAASQATRGRRSRSPNLKLSY